MTFKIRGRAKSLLFPIPLRQFPGQRWARIAVRTWHLGSMGFLLGGAALGQPLGDQPAAMWNTLFSGAVFVALELYASCLWFLQLKGLAVIIKLAFFGAAALLEGDAMPFLLAALVVGGISSHMPGKYRYYSLWHGRVVKE